MKWKIYETIENVICHLACFFFHCGTWLFHVNEKPFLKWSMNIHPLALGWGTISTLVIHLAVPEGSSCLNLDEGSAVQPDEKSKHLFHFAISLEITNQMQIWSNIVSLNNQIKANCLVPFSHCLLNVLWHGKEWKNVNLNQRH